MSSVGKFAKLKYLNSSPTEYSSTYNVTYAKSNAMEFELEQARETIMKLRNELTNKKKEISLLKVNKNRGEGEHMKTIKILEEILKKCDKESKRCINSIENKVNSEENITPKNNDDLNAFNDNEENQKEFFLTEQNFYSNPKTAKLLPKLFLNKEQRKKIGETLYITSLKQQINLLTEELTKKNELLEELKKNSNPQNFSKLQSKYMKNFNELNQIKKQNEIIKSKISTVAQLLLKEKDDNNMLKTKLKEYNGHFREFKESSVKKTNELENKLSLAREKERECRIFHVRRAETFHTPPPGEEIKKQGSDERLDAAENEIKQMSKTMTMLKKQKNNKDEEVKKLNEEKKELNNDINKLKEENKKYCKDIKELKKKLIESKEEILKLHKENEYLSKLKDDVENKLDTEKNQTKAFQELYDDSEKENKKLKNEINKLKKEIEDLKKQLKEDNKKDDFFFTEVKTGGIKKNDFELSIIPKNEVNNSEDYDNFLKNSNNKLLQSDNSGNYRYTTDNKIEENQNKKEDKEKNTILEKSGEKDSA